MSKADTATEMMATHRLNCAQSVLTAFCEELGLEKGLATRIAGGFGAGIARTDNICGAITGAYMVLGLQPYPEITDPRQRLDRVYANIQTFQQKFLTLHGSIRCTDLLGYNLSTPEGLANARAQNLSAVVCPKLVGDAVTILVEMAKT
jgi:C_GCAxxG_C_C family probable redox protein